MRTKAEGASTQEVLALSLYQNENFDAAQPALQALVDSATTNVNVYACLALVYLGKREFHQGIRLIKLALQLNPLSAELLNNLGMDLYEIGALREGCVACRLALRTNPGFVEAWNTFGLLLETAGELELAINAYLKALQILPGHPCASANLGAALLLLGYYEVGWRKYEYRFQAPGGTNFLHAHPRSTRLRALCLDENISSLLIVTEQGIGDTLQYIRYLPVIRRMGIIPRLCAPVCLHGLITESGIDSSPLPPEEANEISEGVWLPLLSLPGFLGVSPTNPIVTEPYLRASHAAILRWAKVFRYENRPLVGLNWQGNPAAETRGMRGRSVPLQCFASLARCKSVTFVSLQKGYGQEQLEACSLKQRFVEVQGLVD